MSDKLKLAKWIKWIDFLYNEVLYLFTNRFIFIELQTIINSNTRIQKPSIFYDQYRINYATTILMNLRRLLEPNKSGVTFYELLDDICINPKVITRKYHVSLYKQKNMGGDTFNKYAGKTTGDKDFLDINIVFSDKSSLEKNLNQIKPLIDKIIAHRDKNPPKVLHTYNDIDEIINFIGDLTKKYYLILKAGSITNLTPTIQYDWKEIFTEAWINV